MSQKKSPAQEDLSNLSVRRRQEVAEAQQAKKRKRIYFAIGIVVVILVAALLIWDSGIVQRNAAAYTVNGYKFTTTDVDYYYHNQLNQFLPYASYYGLDTTQPLEEQPYSETQSWKDFLMDSAKTTMQDIAVLCIEARANGYTLSEEGQKAVEDGIESARSAAESNSTTLEAYLRYGYGKLMTVSAFKHVISEYQLAVEYAGHLQDSYDITDGDLQAYYDEHTDELDTFDYDAYYFDLGLTAEYDDEGNQKDYDPEALAAAQEAAAAKADELKEVMATGTQEELESKAEELGASSMSGVPAASLNYYPFGAWVADTERKTGDTDIVEGSTTDSTGAPYTNGYYVVRFNDRTLDEYHGVSFYNLLVQAQPVASEDESAEPQYDWDAAQQKVASLEAAWETAGHDADSFLSMANDNTDGSTTEYTNVAKGTQNEEVDQWLFGEEHAQGDYVSLKDETLHGYRMIYFTGYDELANWQRTARTAIASQRYNDWADQQKENLTITETSMMSQIG